MTVWSSRKWRYVPALMGCVLLISAVMAWRLISLVCAEPTIKIDYLAEYNRITKPADYDPARDAAPHYERLFSELTALAESLTTRHKAWPPELEPNEVDALQTWATANSSALEEMRKAAQCPYWWVEKESSDGSMAGIGQKHVAEQREFSWGVALFAKYKASRGDTDGSLRYLADLHMTGMHRSRGDTLVEQLVGLAVCELSYEAVRVVLSKCDVPLGEVARMREIFASRIPQIEVPRFARGEFLVALDAIQRCFTDDAGGDGRLIPKYLYSMKKDGGLYVAPLSYPEAVWICLSHPGRKETLQTYHVFYEKLKKLALEPPWQLHARSATCTDELNTIVEGNFFLQDGIQAFEGVIEIGWRSRTHGEATKAILAILAYRARTGHFPDSLAELVAVGGLDGVPIDPYSGKPLVYKIVGKDFALYSVGADFSDNDGLTTSRSWFETGEVGDYVFWPVQDTAQDL